jgi:hypothetical protein
VKQYGIVHPHMLERLRPNFYPSLCTLNGATTIINSFGEEEHTWGPVAGLVDIACRIAPDSSREARTPQQEFVEARLHVTLNGYYPAIDSDMQPVIDGKAYTMEGEPEDDGNDKTTRFYVREVE